MRTDSLDVSTGFDYANMHTAHGIGLNFEIEENGKVVGLVMNGDKTLDLKVSLPKIEEGLKIGRLGILYSGSAPFKCLGEIVNNERENCSPITEIIRNGN